MTRGGDFFQASKEGRAVMASDMMGGRGLGSGGNGFARRDFQESSAQAGGAAVSPARQAGGDGTQRTVGAHSMKMLLTNKLLCALPDEEFGRLLPDLEPVSLSARQNLDDMHTQTRHVYFPEDAVISHFAILSDGNSVEVSMTGRDGVAGLDLVFGHRPPSHVERATIPGSALRMKATLFEEEISRGGSLQRLLFEHTGRHLAQISQRSACATRHRLEERLAVWLLMMHERSGADALPFTQELIADCLGMRRAGVTQAAIGFQERGLISYTRGLIRLLDIEGLMRAACECYGVLRNA